MTIIDTLKILAVAAAVAGAPAFTAQFPMPDLAAMLAKAEGMAMARIDFSTRVPIEPFDSLQALR